MSIATAQTVPAPARETHVYKLVSGCEIKADVFGAQPGAAKPAVLWIHGGGLIFGSRTRPRPAFLAALLQAGAVVVSVDHRLAPQARLPDIVKDIADAARWVAEQGPALLGIDGSRLAMAGGSSGAYLSLLSACARRYGAHSLPRALVSFWGFGDITTPWEAEPSAHYLQTEPLVTREQALAAVGQATVSEDAGGVRSAFYIYCRQQGRWPQEVAGHDPRQDPRWFDAWCPARNVTAQFPPTMLIHGSADTDVPCEESQFMARRLAAARVDHELIILPGIGHGLSGASTELVTSIEQRAAAFLMARLG